MTAGSDPFDLLKSVVILTHAFVRQKQGQHIDWIQCPLYAQGSKANIAFPPILTIFGNEQSISPSAIALRRSWAARRATAYP